ncbi:MAG: hypothetical protein WA814_08110 [Candidatus Baltobacteraceae bacterium]
MTLAIRGDRASCLSLQLGPRSWLLAVARGFGSVGGVATESALLARLRIECDRRVRSARFRRAIDRPQSAATAMLAVLTRVNGDLFASTASHDDYVTAASSLTAVLVVHGRAYVMHAGATAAYLVRDREMVALSGDDLFDDLRMPLLARAFAAAPVLDVTVSSTVLEEGDVLVLLGRRVRNEADCRLLLAPRENGDAQEHVLIARFEHDDAPEPQTHRVVDVQPAGFGPAVARAVAGIAFFIASVYVH